MTYYVTVKDLNIPYEIEKTKRKTYGITMKPGGTVSVRIPMYGSISYARSMVESKKDWIYKNYIRLKDCPKVTSKKDKSEYEKRLETPYRKAAADYIPKRVAYFAQLLDVTYGRISIRDQKTRWGSCSSSGNLNFNYRLMLAPPKVLDYVVIHELCHRIEMNHSPKFWKCVESIMPEYRTQRQWLKENGSKLSPLVQKDRPEHFG